MLSLLPADRTLSPRDIWH